MPKKGASRLPSLRQRAVASAGIGTYRYTYEGVVERMDALAFAIFGLEEHFSDPREVVGRNLTELFEYVHPVGEGRKQVERFGRVHGLERRFRTLRGQPKWVLADLWHIEGENGSPPLIEAVVRDITRLKLVEEQLRENDERWQQLYNQSAAPKLIIDADTGEIVDANLAAEAFYGWSRAALRERTLASLVEGMDEGGSPRAVEVPFAEQRHRRAQGEPCAVLVQSTPYTSRGRDLLLWSVCDMTARQLSRTALEARDERFRRITAADADYLYRVRVVDGQAVETEHEPGCLAVTGYASEALRQDPYLWLSMVWVEDRDAVVRQAERALAATAFEPLEHRIVRKDGSVRWVCNTPVPEFDCDGRLVAYDGLIRDITIRKRLEAELDTITEALDLTLDAVLMLDPDSMRIMYANQGAVSLFGLAREHLLRFTPLDVFPEYSAQGLRQLLEPLREHPGNTARLETHVLHADGRLVPVEVFVQYIDPKAGPGRIVATLRDISDRLRTAAILRESESSLARAQQIAHLGSWTHAVGSGSIVLSLEARAVLGQPDDAETVPFPGLLEALADSRDWPDLKEALDASLARGMAFEQEFHAHLPYGRKRHLEWNTVVVTNDAGEVIEIHGTVQDITERKRAEAERLKLEAKMRHAQKLESLGVLAGGIAHDFNNILTAILGNADLLLEDMPEDGPQRRRLASIEAAARRAAYLSQQMLSYSGRGNFIIRLVNLNDIVRESSVLLSASIPKSIALHFDYDEPQPPIQADSAQISQLIVNLVTNAAEAIGDAPGEITVRTSRVAIGEDAPLLGVDDDPLEPGEYVCLEVIDNGCGMSEDVKGRLFDPFFSTKFTGRGLGLAAVLGIVRAHYGAMEVTSSPGQGARFRVLFPAAAGQAHHSPESSPLVAADYRGEGAVLLVDDEPAVRTVGKRMLERLGFTVVTAEDGIEGVERFREHHEDIVCILMDLVMPRMDGAEALREISRIEPGVPVVLCSGYSREELTARFAGQGVAGFLHKPFRMRQLAAAMHGALKPP